VPLVETVAFAIVACSMSCSDVPVADVRSLESDVELKDCGTPVELENPKEVSCFEEVTS
jgi:hypothetical protein